MQPLSLTCDALMESPSDDSKFSNLEVIDASQQEYRTIDLRLPDVLLDDAADDRAFGPAAERR